MMINGGDVRLQLGKGDFLTLEEARGARLTSVIGSAWITVDRDASDVVIGSGDSFVIPSDRSVLVGPIVGEVTLELQCHPSKAGCRVLNQKCNPIWTMEMPAGLTSHRI